MTIPPLPKEDMHHGSGISPLKILREFDYGTVTQENGRTVREFR
ncbi:hypothetical protein ACN4EG_00650 [Alkalinema pantanalense CENA528]